MKNTSKLLLGALVALFAVACGPAKPATTTGAIASNAPAWVNQGGAAFNDGNFYGVGMVTGVKNRALAIDAADARARAKVAESLKTEVTRLLKDYMASTTAGDMTASSEEQDITSAIKSFTQMELNGAIIIDHWKDPEDGTLFSLAKLDLAAVEKTIAQQKELSPKVKALVKANAAKAFEDLNAEAEKH